MNPKHICIVGGKGQMGQLFTRLLQQLGHQISIIDQEDWADAPHLLAQAQLVIVSVPIKYTSEIIARVVPFLATDTILADFTSLKVEPVLSMLSQHSGPVVGLHPMFGPTINTTHAQVIIYCDGRHREAYQWLLNDLAHLGFTLKQLSASEHDQAMSFIQGIEHFITFSLGTFLMHKNEHPQQLLEIASPIYLAKLLLLGRIFDQDPALYADIIMADPARIQLIQEFANWLQEWALRLTTSNKQEFIDAFSAASRWMGSFTQHAQQVSDHFLNIEKN